MKVIVKRTDRYLNTLAARLKAMIDEECSPERIFHVIYEDLSILEIEKITKYFKDLADGFDPVRYQQFVNFGEDK